MRIGNSVSAVVQDGEFVGQVRVILRDGELITGSASYCLPGEGDIDRYIDSTIFRILRCNIAEQQEKQTGVTVTRANTEPVILRHPL